MNISPPKMPIFISCPALAGCRQNPSKTQQEYKNSGKIVQAELFLQQYRS